MGVEKHGNASSPSTASDNATQVSIVSGATSLGNKAFSPNHVKIKVGSTVIWTNNDNNIHTVASGVPNTPNAGQVFDSGLTSLISPSKTYSHKFTSAGEFSYFCRLYPNMTGQIEIVQVQKPIFFFRLIRPILYENAMLPTHIAIIVDDDRDVNLVLSATLKLKKFDVHKTYSAEECLNKLKQFQAKVDVIFVNGKIAEDRGAMLIVKIKRINPDIKVCVVAEDETAKTRVLDYGADEFMTKPIGTETIVYKMMMLLTTKYSKVER